MGLPIMVLSILASRGDGPARRGIRGQPRVRGSLAFILARIRSYHLPGGSVKRANLILETSLKGVVKGKQAPSLTIPAYGSYAAQLVVGEAAIENLRKEINQIYFVAIATVCN
jgi:hypothetical protein